ncbi:hypothetical protein EON65_55100, partial [archaeon]
MSFGLLAIFTLLVATGFIGQSSQAVLSTSDSTDKNALAFFLLGDWGKGGSTGAYASSPDDDDILINHMNATTFDSSSMRQQDNQNNNKNNKVFYQVQVAKAMGQFAASASPAPSFVLALGDNF